MAIGAMDYKLGAARKEGATLQAQWAQEKLDEGLERAKLKTPNRKSLAKKAWWDKKREEERAKRNG